MSRLSILLMIAVVLGAVSGGAGRAQMGCTVGPLSAAALGSGPDALNAALACIERRLQALEQAGGTAETDAAGAGPIASLTVLDTITVTLEHASVAKRNQLVLEYDIVNQGPDPVRVIVAAFLDSSVTLRGEGMPRSFRIAGMAVCPTYQTNVTQNCIDRFPEAQWTLLNPGVPYGFQLATDPGHGPIESDGAVASLRLIVDQDGDVQFQDVPFARIPLGG